MDAKRCDWCDIFYMETETLEQEYELLRNNQSVDLCNNCQDRLVELKENISSKVQTKDLFEIEQTIKPVEITVTSDQLKKIKNPRAWTEAEDNLLREKIIMGEKKTSKEWDSLLKHFTGRTKFALKKHLEYINLTKKRKQKAEVNKKPEPLKNCIICGDPLEGNTSLYRKYCKFHSSGQNKGDTRNKKQRNKKENDYMDSVKEETEEEEKAKVELCVSGCGKPQEKGSEFCKDCQVMEEYYRGKK